MKFKLDWLPDTEEAEHALVFTVRARATRDNGWRIAVAGIVLHEGEAPPCMDMLSANKHAAEEKMAELLRINPGVRALLGLRR